MTALAACKQEMAELSGVDRRDRTVGAVRPDDGVQVHDASALELGHPAEGETHHPAGIGLRAAEDSGELALGVDHRAGAIAQGCSRAPARRPRRRSDRGRGECRPARHGARALQSTPLVGDERTAPGHRQA